MRSTPGIVSSTSIFAWVFSPMTAMTVFSTP